MNPEVSEKPSEPPNNLARLSTPLLIVISGPSGGGKTTLFERLIGSRPEMTRAVTCTTRQPRPGERDAVDYYFLTADSFLRRVQAGHFVEHAPGQGQSTGPFKPQFLAKRGQAR